MADVVQKDEGMSQGVESSNELFKDLATEKISMVGDETYGKFRKQKEDYESKQKERLQREEARFGLETEQNAGTRIELSDRIAKLEGITRDLKEEEALWGLNLATQNQLHELPQLTPAERLVRKLVAKLPSAFDKLDTVVESKIILGAGDVLRREQSATRMAAEELGRKAVHDLEEIEIGEKINSANAESIAARWKESLKKGEEKLAQTRVIWESVRDDILRKDAFVSQLDHEQRGELIGAFERKFSSYKSQVAEAARQKIQGDSRVSQVMEEVLDKHGLATSEADKVSLEVSYLLSGFVADAKTVGVAREMEKDLEADFGEDAHILNDSLGWEFLRVGVDSNGKGVTREEKQELAEITADVAGRLFENGLLGRDIEGMLATSLTDLLERARVSPHLSLIAADTDAAFPLVRAIRSEDLRRKVYEKAGQVLSEVDRYASLAINLGNTLTSYDFAQLGEAFPGSERIKRLLMEQIVEKAASRWDQYSAGDLAGATEISDMYTIANFDRNKLATLTRGDFATAVEAVISGKEPERDDETPQISVGDMWQRENHKFLTSALQAKSKAGDVNAGIIAKTLNALSEDMNSVSYVVARNLGEICRTNPELYQLVDKNGKGGFVFGDKFIKELAYREDIDPRDKSKLFSQLGLLLNEKREIGPINLSLNLEGVEDEAKNVIRLLGARNSNYLASAGDYLVSWLGVDSGKLIENANRRFDYVGDKVALSRQGWEDLIKSSDKRQIVSVINELHERGQIDLSGELGKLTRGEVIFIRFIAELRAHSSDLSEIAGWYIENGGIDLEKFNNDFSIRVESGEGSSKLRFETRREMLARLLDFKGNMRNLQELYSAGFVDLNKADISATDRYCLDSWFSDTDASTKILISQIWSRKMVENVFAQSDNPNKLADVLVLYRLREIDEVEPEALMKELVRQDFVIRKARVDEVYNKTGLIFNGKLSYRLQMLEALDEPVKVNFAQSLRKYGLTLRSDLRVEFEEMYRRKDEVIAKIEEIRKVVPDFEYKVEKGDAVDPYFVVKAAQLDSGDFGEELLRKIVDAIDKSNFSNKKIYELRVIGEKGILPIGMIPRVILKGAAVEEQAIDSWEAILRDKGLLNKENSRAYLHLAEVVARGVPKDKFGIFGSVLQKVPEAFVQEGLQGFLVDNIAKLDLLPTEKIGDYMKVFKLIDDSPSMELQRVKATLLANIIDTPDPVGSFAKIEDVFVRNHLPLAAKVYSVFTILHPQEVMAEKVTKEGISPVLKGIAKQQSKKVAYERQMGLILNDVLKVSFESGSKNLRDYLGVLWRGEAAYEQVRGGVKLEDLTLEQRRDMLVFGRKFKALVESSLLAKRGRITVGEINQENVVGQIGKLSEVVGVNRSSGQGILDRLSQMYLRGMGITSRAELEMKIRELASVTQEANLRGVRFADRFSRLTLAKGDLLKGVDHRYLSQMLADGILCKELLGSDAGSDWTPFDIDLAQIIEGDTQEGNKGALAKSPAGGYGSLILVVKNPEGFVQRTQDGEDVNSYKKDKYEGFVTGKVDEQRHVGIRSGIPSTKVTCMIAKDDLLVSGREMDTICYQIARNGFYIPIYSTEGKLVFSKRAFDEIRASFVGVAEYGGDYFDQSNINANPEIVNQVKDNEEKVRKISNQIGEKINQSLEENHISRREEGDMGLLGAEVYDTGSTGRFTNDPTGKIDFDLTIELDAIAYKDKDKVVAALKSKFGGLGLTQFEDFATNSPDFYQIRMTGVSVGEETVDIDIGISKRNKEKVFASHDAIKAKLQNIKSRSEQDYYSAVANIVEAKRMLSGASIYKKTDKGLGGIGVENWILKHAGSLDDAMSGFYRAAHDPEGKLLPLSEFRKAYPIWDAGLNLRGSEVDNYVYKLDETSYDKMIKVIEEKLGIDETSIETVSNG